MAWSVTVRALRPNTGVNWLKIYRSVSTTETVDDVEVTTNSDLLVDEGGPDGNGGRTFTETLTDEQVAGGVNYSMTASGPALTESIPTALPIDASVFQDPQSPAPGATFVSATEM